MKQHILVVSQYFYPEQFRINDLCTEWFKRGYRVTVITGIPDYPQGRFYDGYGWFRKTKETYNGIDIIRLPIIPRGDNVFMLSLNYLSFVISGFFWKAFTKIRADLVFIFEVSPMTQALIGVWYAKKIGIPCYLYVQDLWPENVEVIAGITNPFIIRSISKMVNYIYHNSTRIFTTSNSFVTAINNRGVPLEKIEFWPQYAEDFYRPMEESIVDEIPQDGTFNITYTGNIGSAQGLDILPKAAVVLKTLGIKKRVRFNIIGDGGYKNTLVQMINSMGVADMFNFIQPQPASSIPKFLAASDVGFLSLIDNPLFRMTIPAKLQSYMACGIPIIAAADGETRDIIEASKSGRCCSAGDPDALAMLIVDMLDLSKEDLMQMGKNACEYCSKFFNKQKLLDRMDRVFNEQYVSEARYHVWE